jgi:heme exporter protein C
MNLGSFASRALGLRWQVFPPLAGVAVMAMIIGAVIAAPREIIQGEVQRLLYIHVPSIIAAYISFGVVFIASIVVLWKRDMRWDAVARGAATVGVLFVAFNLLTGMLWGKPIWGVYWQWDARLTSTLILFLLFGAYLIARAVSDPDDEQTARYSAVFAIIATLDIPLIHMSVRWWRTLHPGPTVTEPGALPDEMRIVLLISMIGIITLAAWLILLRSEAERVGQRLRRARALIDQREGA